MVKDTAEAVAEVVEKASTVAEKASSEVAEQLPENGRLRAAAVLLEHASKEVGEEAHLAQDILHKVHTELAVPSNEATQLFYTRKSVFLLVAPAQTCTRHYPQSSCCANATTRCIPD